MFGLLWLSVASSADDALERLIDLRQLARASCREGTFDAFRPRCITRTMDLSLLRRRTDHTLRALGDGHVTLPGVEIALDAPGLRVPCGERETQRRQRYPV
jgi:hypothetical protein